MTDQLVRRLEALEIRLTRLEARIAKALGVTESQEVKARRHNDAVEVLLFLNQKAKKSFRFLDTNLRFIEARLMEGTTVQDCKAVIAAKVRDWGDDPKMCDYLRPSTLFNAEKFESYVGMLTPIDSLQGEAGDVVEAPKPTVEGVE